MRPFLIMLPGPFLEADSVDGICMVGPLSLLLTWFEHSYATHSGAQGQP